MVLFRLARNGSWEEARAFVEAIELVGLRVSRNQQEALLSALCIGERWLDAVTVVNTMLQQSTAVDNATAGLAMKAYASVGLKDHWKSALNLMKRAHRATEGSMLDDGVDASSWRCLLAGLASEGLNEEAALVMREMAGAGVRVDEHSGAVLVTSAHKAGDYAGALAWITRLREAGLPVSRNGYAAAVDACCSMGNPGAAMGVLGAMAEDGVVPSASVYNAVFETICPPSEGGYDGSRRWKEEGGGQEAFLDGGGVGEGGKSGGSGVSVVAGCSEGAGGGGGGGIVGGDGGSGAGGSGRSIVVEVNGVVGVGGGGEGGAGVGGREGRTGFRRRDPRAAEKADDVTALFKSMAERGVPMNGVTYALVMAALLAAERVDDVLRLWKQAWSDPSASPLRRDMAHRVLGICRAQGRGRLAVQLVEVGARLASRGDVLWPGARSYWAAMEACELEGASAWRGALALVDAWDAGLLPPDDLFADAAAQILQQAATAGAAEAVEASAARVWRAGAGGGGGDGRVTATAVVVDAEDAAGGGSGEAAAATRGGGGG